MAPKWTPCKVQKLLQLLADNHENLFDISALNSQRKLNKNTFGKISIDLDMPYDAVRYKYFGLNNAYNAELKKIEEAKQKGFFYRPTLSWFNDYRTIMEKINLYYQDILGKVDISFQEEQEESNVSEVELSMEEEESPPSDVPEADRIVVSIKQECIDRVKMGICDIDFVETIQPVQSIESLEMETITPDQHIQMPKVKRTLNTGGNHVDEFQLFANHVAEQLRSMNNKSARKMQDEIHTIFDEEGFPFHSSVLDNV